MHLDRQGGVNRQDFEEEREPVAVPVGAQEPAGLLCNQFVKLLLRAVNGGNRRGGRVRPYPHFSLGLVSGHGHPTHTAQDAARTPCVVLDLIFQTENFAHARAYPFTNRPDGLKLSDGKPTISMEFPAFLPQL